MENIILKMKGITKLFPGVKALDNVNLEVKENEIHALVGENGAGKSTLMNVLSGIYPYGSYSGEIYFKGKLCSFKNIKDSEKLGIVIIHQELALIPYLSIAENIFLGNEKSKNGVINWNTTINKSKELLKRVRLDESPDKLIANIGVGKQQLVEIAKALSKNVSLLILDEPTAALNDEDSKVLLDLLIELKAQGVSSILISHKLNEISDIADRITIIRDGSTIETLDKKVDGINEDRIIKGMVGRDLIDRFPKRNSKIGEVSFEVKNWNVYDTLDTQRQIIKNINLNIRRGEVVGIAGLMGAGRTELAMSIFGRSFGSKISGVILKDNKEVSFKNVKEAIKSGVAYVTEDRKNCGLILIDNIKNNITLASLNKISKNNVVNNNDEIKVAESFRSKMNIKSSSILQNTGDLSGGNQQKVVLSKWIFSEPDVLILDEPTRGIDVGAKYEIYTLINELAESGKSILIISSELPEVLGLSDRIYVMNDGRIVGELDKEEASQENIMRCIVNS
ncbi:multiple monosaccharide ABC transporter ATP-binding protein [Clostridium sp. D46t1_190503_E9]|uniref:multiple monosaccharide ABC transporter ATP-binding protein n=1 Tax=Clostridium sp. D46t1_190503_E9 TaxID=2787137 RepID=UPI001897067A|nr:multiple monosaccharide ABC transporter ATP-binding protein [Clostridium sp. D46t1_190503_E9]